MARERRKNIRVQWNSSAMIHLHEGDRGSSCIVSDFSNGGAKISDVNPSAIPDQFILRMIGGLKPRKCHVLWRSAEALGVEFLDRQATAEGTSTVARAPRRTKRPARAT